MPAKKGDRQRGGGEDSKKLLSASRQLRPSKQSGIEGDGAGCVPGDDHAGSMVRERRRGHGLIREGQAVPSCKLSTGTEFGRSRKAREPWHMPAGGHRRAFRRQIIATGPYGLGDL